VKKATPFGVAFFLHDQIDTAHLTISVATHKVCVREPLHRMGKRC